MAYKSPYKKIDYPVVMEVGKWGVKWRGQDIPKPDSAYPNDYEAIFGFTCAYCGASSQQQSPVPHNILCERWYEID
jgi:hypothetical protein